MKLYLSLLLTVLFAATGCISTMPMKTSMAPAVSFSDAFNNGYGTRWKFYQGSHQFKNGVLRLNVNKGGGQYAYIRTNWQNVSVQADVAMLTNSFGASIGGRYNVTNGASYQLWIYQSGRLTIEKYNNWFNTWNVLAETSIPSPSTYKQTLRLTIQTNVLTAYLNGEQKLTYTDDSPNMTSGGVCLSLHAPSTSTGMSADFDNVLVHDLDVTTFGDVVRPTLVSGLTNIIGIQGNDITLSVAVTGTPLSYHWRRPNGSIVPGTNTYTISNAQYANKGTYTVIVTNALGRVSSASYVAVATTNILTNCVTYKPASVTLGWCPSPDTNVTGYTLYYGSGPMPTNYYSPEWVSTNGPCDGYYTNKQLVVQFLQYTKSQNAESNLTCVVSNLVRGIPYFFAVTAHDNYGLESDFSPEVSYTAPSADYPYTFTTIIAKLNNKTVLQTKVCPYTLMNVYFSTNIAAANWPQIATNAPADSYGNFIFTHEVLSAWQGFYRLERQ